MSDREPNLLLELENDRTSGRRRETFLLSVILHLVIVLLIVTQPEFLRKLFQTPVQPVKVQPQELTMLYEPPDLPKSKTAPKTHVLSNANHRAHRGMQAPPPRLRYTPPPAPKAPVPAPAPAPPAPKPGEHRMARQLAPIGIPKFPEPPKKPPKQQPTLEPVPPPREPNPSEARLKLPRMVSPSRGTDAILRGLAKEHATGGGQAMGEEGGGYPDYGSRSPNLNIPGPQILSDTMGVNFNPYLLRILSTVRRNWYAVIPEIARLGKQGRVVLQFSILRNGNVPSLMLESGSGTDSLDGAALSSIRLSSPFPPLPPEFPGHDIRLRFVYLYNLPVNQ